MRDKSLPDSHLAMLRAQCRARNSTITATKLAEAADFENYNASNIHYGKLGFNVAVHVRFQPQLTRRDGSLCWWTTLSYSIDGASEPDTGHFQFVMRPKLVAALREMRWA